MILDPEVHRPEAARRIAKFVRDQCKACRRDGVVSGMSGGLDSSTAAALCVRALGPERVLGLVLCDKESDSQNILDAKEVAGRLGMAVRMCDMTGALRHIGADGRPFSKVPTHRLRERTIGAVRRMWRRRVRDARLLSAIKRTTRNLAGHEAPYSLAKHRLRMLLVYFHAERRNLMVVGCANGTERKMGLCCKYAVDDCAHIMPIADLYHTHIARLALHLGLQERIATRPPSTALLPGVRDKYRHFFGLEAKPLDAILNGLDSGVPVEDIADALQTESEAVRRIAHLLEESSCKRAAPGTPGAL